MYSLWLKKRLATSEARIIYTRFHSNAAGLIRRINIHFTQVEGKKLFVDTFGHLLVKKWTSKQPLDGAKVNVRLWGHLLVGQWVTAAYKFGKSGRILALRFVAQSVLGSTCFVWKSKRDCKSKGTPAVATCSRPGGNLREFPQLFLTFSKRVSTDS